MNTSNPEPATGSSNFVRDIIVDDLKTNKYQGRVHTRFPPEPNGYLHIGHAKSICLNFGLAAEFGGKTNLRFDDTNPSKEETEYVDSIIDNVHWLGFDWEGRLFYASDYFGQLYEWAAQLIGAGHAFVCDLTAEEIRKTRGTLTEPGTESPYRNRSVTENLDLFARMKAGEFPDGARTLRAKIDMASANLNLRDPIMYRILHAEHHRTGNQWCIYPIYDFAHGQSDSIERVTHSICTLEFEDHRPLYDWYIEQLGIYHPQQIEFDRLNLTYTLLSKRKLLTLVQEGRVRGWDDPRMPTLSGIRRRGYTPEAIRNFCGSIGVSKTNGSIELGLLEHYVREDLNKRSPRVMAVLRPLKVVIDNYPDGQVEEMEAVNNPEDAGAGTRKVPFSKVLYIEQDDFREDPPKQFYRLSPGREVRLRYGYLITCINAVKNQAGEPVEVHCTYDPATRGGNTPDGRKVKSTIHWVSAEHAVSGEVRLYESLFSKEDPNQVDEGQDFTANLNPKSLEVVTDCKLEPGLAGVAAGGLYQFERLGYFCVDADSAPGKPVFNRTVALKDAWAKIEKRGGAGVRAGGVAEMIILGIGGLLGGAASAILKDGELVAAVEESKLVRRRTHWASLGEMPEHAIATCLELAGAKPDQVQAVAIVRPIPDSDFHLKLRAQFPNSRIVVLEHHLAHAASAYYCSPFDQATVLTLDRGGDFRCGARWQARGTQLTLEAEHYSPDSFGLLYTRVAELLGFMANVEEHKLQWLSIAGDDRFKDLFLEILNFGEESGPRLDRSFFSAERMSRGGFSARFFERLGLPDGQAIPETLRAHVAAGIQRAVEAAVIRMAGAGTNLCLAGGLGLNALLVSALENAGVYQNVFVQPAAGNAGTAIGAVLEAWHGVYRRDQRVALKTLSLGPSYSAAEIKQVLENCKLRFHYLVTTDEVIDSAVAQLNDHKIVAWMHGRMEFGSRALGNRSILASPLNPYSTENLNSFIKHREPFRKFAASVPAELCSGYFEVGANARYLATIGRVRPEHRDRFAGAILAGDLLRVHTVDREENPLYWKLLHAAGKATGLPVLYNTSFNLFGESLVCTPRDAVRSFYSSGIDAMFVGNFFLQK